MNMIYFTSDLHLSVYPSYSKLNPGIEYRDYNTDRIIENWNKTIRPEDVVYVLGDFGSFRSIEDVEETLASLNGKKHLIVGNNDNYNVINAKGWASVTPLKDIRVKYRDELGTIRYQNIVLCHYAMTVWKNSGRGSWMLFGHSHGTLPDDKGSLQMDVGVESNNFRPVSFREVKIFMSQKKYVPKDYHGRYVSSSYSAALWDTDWKAYDGSIDYLWNDTKGKAKKGDFCEY
jgi:calcineurin-like phosphoesterase family protein